MQTKSTSPKYCEPIEVRVTRYQTQRIQRGQLFAPIALGSGILARRFPQHVNPYLVLAITVALLVYMLSAIKPLGKRSLRTENSAINLEKGLRITRASVTHWAHDRDLVRVFGSDTSIAMRARLQDAHELQVQLTRTFGKGLALQPRGSLLARRIVIGLGVAGMLVAIGAIVSKQFLLLFLGLPIALSSLATYALLRQRVCRL